MLFPFIVACSRFNLPDLALNIPIDMWKRNITRCSKLRIHRISVVTHVSSNMETNADIAPSSVCSNLRRCIEGGSKLKCCPIRNVRLLSFIAVSGERGGGVNMGALYHCVTVFQRSPTFHADDSLTDFESRSFTPKFSYEQLLS